MKEIEVKILDIDKKKVVEKLKALGAKKTFDGEVHGYFFDFPDSCIRKAKDTLRLRKVGDKSFLTFKKYVNNRGAKVREEFEVEVADFEAAKKILESVGLSAWMDVRKHRSSYALGGVHFELDKHADQYIFVPEFLEIEAKDAATVRRYAGLLGYGKKDLRPWTIIEVAKHYGLRDKK
jgi:adenylate cyclase, class 2